MARLPYLTVDDLAEDDKKLLARPIALPRLLAYSPAGTRAFSHLGGYIRSKSTLDPRLREMAILQVGYSTGSEYEYSHHIKLGIEQFGVSPDDVRAIATETAGGESSLGDVEKAVLRAAREMTDEAAMGGDTFAFLRQELGEEHLMDLMFAISFYCGVVRILASIEIDVEDDYLHYLDEYPLTRVPAT